LWRNNTKSINQFLDDLYNYCQQVVELVKKENEASNENEQTLVQQDTEIQESQANIPMDTQTFTLKYDGNGHTSGNVPIDPNRYTKSEDITLNNGSIIKKEGYTFMGWGETPNSNWWVAPIINITEDTILYAVWRLNSDPSLRPTVNTNEITVYITPSGNKYHRINCRTIRGSKTAISVTDARNRGYGACQICRP
jgi:hypothetical protein